MKMTSLAAALSGALVLCLGFATVHAQETLPASAIENSNLWFVELSGKPNADGSSLASTQQEKKNFRAAAAEAGVSYTERATYDVLFNGLAIEVSPVNRQKIKGISGVKALWPIETVSIPDPEDGAGSAPNLETAIAMTGADDAHSLGFRGEGVRVAVMDTGIDYDHADFGGDGTARSNSDQFPNARVVAGFDFVGDAFTGGNTPVPDAFPDDCNSHGSHVAGIVGANGGAVGVAPDVVFGAYRVFGCDGSTTSDIMLAAMERALKDNMDVLNMSIGARAQWPQYPTAAAATRLLKKGMVVVASIGNNGPGGSVMDGPYAAGAPGVGHDVIGVASYDNSHVRLPFFTVNDEDVGYQVMTFSIPAPTSGTEEIVNVGRGCADGDLATPGAQPDPYLGDPNGKVALIVRGVCGFAEKAIRAIAAGATAVVVYNNVPGVVAGSLVAPLANPRPVVGISQDHGNFIIAQADPTSMTWTTGVDSFPSPTGNLISGFSSFGMAADLTLKPDIGAPGGSIFSTIPLELGGYGVNSGTSMSSPHVAGAVALLLGAEPNIAPSAVRARLQNSADPKNWSGNPGLGFIDYAHRQGAGMVDIDDAILATVDVTPGKLALGESQAGPQTRRLTIKNRGGSAVTLVPGHAPALASGPKNPNNFAMISTITAFASAGFSAPSVTVPAGATRTLDVTITAPTPSALSNLGQYGGYVVLTEEGSGKVYRVPYAGFVGDYQAVSALQNLFGLPWLIRGNALAPLPGGTFTLVGDDVPAFAVHFDHHVQYYEFRITNASSGSPVHPVFSNFDEDEFVGRNLSPGNVFVFAWDGTRAHSNGNNNLRKVVPDGQYIIQLRVLKALGDKNNPAHWETWNSPVVTIDRP